MLEGVQKPLVTVDTRESAKALRLGRPKTSSKQVRRIGLKQSVKIKTSSSQVALRRNDMQARE